MGKHKFKGTIRRPSKMIIII